MRNFFAGVAMLALLGSPAFAQTQTGPSNQPSNQANTGTGHDRVTAQKISQDLQSAGFTDVKVVAESFVVQAKSKDGDPVLMTIGPHGMSVFEAMNSGNSGSGSSSTTGSTANSTSKKGIQN